MKKLVVNSFKGGTGKSTLVCNFGFALSMLNQKVLIIDLDSQNDASMFLGIDKSDYNKYVFDDLFNKKNKPALKDCLVKARENLYLLPNNSLESVESELHKTSRIDVVLNHALAELEDMDFDYVIFDTSPTKTKSLDSILCYCDSLILPVQLTGGGSVRSVATIYDHLAQLYINPSIIKAVVPNMYDPRTNDSKENLEFIQEFFKEQDFVTKPISFRTAIATSSKRGLSVFEHDMEATNQFMEVVEKLITLV